MEPGGRRDGISEIAPIIKEGQSYRYGLRMRSMRHPEGWQAVVRVGKNQEAYAVIHTFDGEIPECIEIRLPEGCPSRIASVYSDKETDITVTDGRLVYRPGEHFRAAAVRLVLES